MGAVYDSSVPEDSQPSAIAWSQVDRPAYFLTESVKQIFAEEQGDVITGFLDDGNGIMIWKNEGIIKLYHTGAPENWYLRKVWNEHGCDTPLSLIKLGDTYYFQYRKKIYSMVSGQAPVDISYGRYASFDGMTIINAVGNDQWLIYSCTESTSHYQMVYDRVVKTWYKFKFGTSDLTCSMIKKYDSIWAGYKNTPFAIVSKIMFDYNTSSILDAISGGDVQVNPEITFPMFNLKGTHAKLRNIVLDYVRASAGNLTLTLTHDDTATQHVMPAPDGVGLNKLNTTLTGLKSYGSFTLKISGVISKLYSILFYLRPTDKGKS